MVRERRYRNRAMCVSMLDLSQQYRVLAGAIRAELRRSHSEIPRDASDSW
jgi:predicted nucleic acid-binding protein